jgi:hypothetical protein
MTSQKPLAATKPAETSGDLVPEPPRDALGLTAEEGASLTDQELAMLADMPRQYARATTHSIMGASRVITAAEKSTSIGRTADWCGAMEELQAASERLRRNDLSQVEDALGHQAIALQALFVRLAEMAFNSLASPHQFDVLMRYALRAQAQGRAAIETLAAIKNPPAVFARQANVTTGPQQINNGIEPRAHAGEIESVPSKLSGAPDELRQDTRTPALARGADPAMAPLGTVGRPEDRSREGALVTQRVERRRQARSSGSSKRPATTGERTPPADRPLTKNRR